MVRIHMERLSFGYGGPIEIIRDGNLELEVGWTGVVGQNGCGKTTLLRLVEGELSPTGGSVRIHPPDARVIACPQQIASITDDIRELAGAWDKRSVALQARLDLDPEELDRWPTLSPGERKRWQIAAALAAEPDVLLLDEPTTHVDVRARALLSSAVRRFGGLGLVVSHDRQLLDELTVRTLRIRRGELGLYPGTYRRAREIWLGERARAENRAARADRALRAEKRRLADERRRHASAARSVKTSARARGTRDADARSMARKFAAHKAEARLGRSVEVRGRAVERAARERERSRLEREPGRAIELAHEASPRRWLASVEVDELRAGPRVLARNVSVFVGRRDRVRIAGPNGAGKSTLLSRLIEAVADLGSVLVVPQELGDDERRRVSREARRLPPAERGQLMQLAASLGLEPERVLASDDLSPGEARKLSIAGGLARRARGLFLDEPTNHLDLPSVERLERALAAYPGALVLISHDEEFARALTTTVWRMDDRQLDGSPADGPRT